MSAVPAYDPSTNFEEEEQNQVAGRSTVRTAALDEELENISASITQLITNATTIQRDDGEIRDGMVKLHTLSTEVLALLGSAGFTIHDPIGWLTATSYAAREIVTQGTGTYVSVVAHTSGVFATDLAAGKWCLIFDSAAFNADQVSFTPTGGIAASTVQTAIAELDTEAAKKASNLSDLTNAATARDNISVPSRADLQNATYVMAAAGGSSDAITGSYTPAVTALTNGMILGFRAGSANTTATPTFTPNSGVIAARTIVKGAGTALVAGDIPGQHAPMELQYNSTLDKWILLNPAIAAGAVAKVGDTMTGALNMSGAAINEAKGSDVASAGTINLDAATGNVVDVTGTTTITAITLTEGRERVVRFTGALTLTHNASIILPGAANITTAAGDFAVFRGYSGGVVRCTNYLISAVAPFDRRAPGAIGGTTPSTIAVADGSAAAPSVKIGDEQNGLFSPEASTIGIAINGAEAIRVDSGGRLIVSGGVAVQTFGGGVTPVIQALGVNSAFSGFGTARYSADASGPIISLAKSRNATVGSHTVVQSADTIGLLSFEGSDGTNFIRGAQLVGEVDGTPGTNDMPGRVRILTTADGASSSTEAFRLDNGQEAYFANIGTTASAANAFLNSGSSPANQLLRSTSSLRYKTNLRDIPKEAIDAVLALKPIKYNSLGKYDNPEWSFYGLGAEDVAAVDPRLVSWGKPVISDQIEEVDVTEEREIDAIETVMEGGLPVLKSVKKVVPVTVKKTARVVRHGDTLVPDGVMYDRIAVMLLSKVRELTDEIAALKAEASGK